MINMQPSSFYDLLPPNLRTPENRALGVALDNQSAKLSDVLRYTLIYAGIANLSESMCDELSRNFIIQGYEQSMDLAVKRDLIQSMIAVGVKLGTTAALDQAVGIIYGGAHTKEWFDYGGEPYHFKVTVDISEYGADRDTYPQIINKVEEYKNVRSVLDDVDYLLTGTGGVYIGANCRQGQIITVWEGD